MWLPRTEALQWTGRRWTREEWGGRCTFWSSPSCTCPFWQRAGMGERGCSWRLPHRYSLWTSETKVYKTRLKHNIKVRSVLEFTCIFQIHLSLEFISSSISRAFKKKAKNFLTAQITIAILGLLIDLSALTPSAWAFPEHPAWHGEKYWILWSLQTGSYRAVVQEQLLLQGESRLLSSSLKNTKIKYIYHNIWYSCSSGCSLQRVCPHTPFPREMYLFWNEHNVATSS